MPQTQILLFAIMLARTVSAKTVPSSAHHTPQICHSWRRWQRIRAFKKILSFGTAYHNWLKHSLQESPALMVFVAPKKRMLNVASNVACNVALPGDVRQNRLSGRLLEAPIIFLSQWRTAANAKYYLWL